MRLGFQEPSLLQGFGWQLYAYRCLFCGDVLYHKRNDSKLFKLGNKADVEEYSPEESPGPCGCLAMNHVSRWTGGPCDHP